MLLKLISEIIFAIFKKLSFICFVVIFEQTSAAAFWKESYYSVTKTIDTPFEVLSFKT